MKTTTIGRETPLLTYQIFVSLAHQNAIREEARTRRTARRAAIAGFLRKMLPFIGNGVVPATAERAIRTLLDKHLNTH